MIHYAYIGNARAANDGGLVGGDENDANDEPGGDAESESEDDTMALEHESEGDTVASVSSVKQGYVNIRYGLEESGFGMDTLSFMPGAIMGANEAGEAAIQAMRLQVS